MKIPVTCHSATYTVQCKAISRIDCDVDVVVTNLTDYLRAGINRSDVTRTTFHWIATHDMDMDMYFKVALNSPQV